MPQKIFDVIVIGSGSAGLSVGLGMQALGFRVMMISKTAHAIGGDCLNDGCIPSKAFIHFAGIAAAAKKANQAGFNITGEASMKLAAEYIFNQQEKIRKHENQDWLEQKGITVKIGSAKFAGKNAVAINGETFKAKKFVIATGSTPSKLDVPGLENMAVYNNESIFTLQNLPKRIVIVGGGPIGIEMAQCFCRMGSTVAVIEKGAHIMAHDDDVVVDILQKQLEKEGIIFYCNAKLISCTNANTVEVQKENSKIFTVDCDAIFAATGRGIDVTGLDPKIAGIEVKEKKPVIDSRLRTSNKNIYACGDVAGDLQFSHAAEFHARIILNNFFSPFKKKLDNKFMSWVTFTNPQLATFGLQQKELDARGIKYIKLEQPFDHDDRAVTDDYTYAHSILYISQPSFLKKQVVLGGTMIAPNAGELVQEMILAMKAGISINQIFEKIYPYPVAARINQKAISQYRKSKLTGGIKKLLRIAFKLMS